MSGRSCCQADFNPVKMIQNLTPLAFFLSCVATVALICDNHIESMESSIRASESSSRSLVVENKPSLPNRLILMRLYFPVKGLPGIN